MARAGSHCGLLSRSMIQVRIAEQLSPSYDKSKSDAGRPKEGRKGGGVKDRQQVVRAGVA